MKILKNPRILLWIFFVAVSIILISPNLNPKGMVVTAKSEKITSIAVGDTIYKINSADVSPELLGRDYSGVVEIATNKGTKFIGVNGTIGLEAEQIELTRLKFGLDLKGGVRAIIMPETSENATLEQIISTLQTRINVYGLRESVFRTVYYEGQGFIEVSIAGGTKDELRSLLESQGKFEAKIPLLLKVSDATVLIRLDKAYEIKAGNSTVTIDGKAVKIGETFNLGGIVFVLNSADKDYINVTSHVFTGEDIITVFFDPQRSRIESVNNGYKWSFGVQISPSGAQKFAWITSNTNVLANGYLNAPIEFYLDDNFIDSLSISSTLRGRPETEISISGFAPSMESAVSEQRKLQSILRSGVLPAKIEIVQLDVISPTLGSGFLKNALLAGIVAILGVISVVSLRYRKPRLVLPMVLISVSEIIIVFGVAVLIGWTIDLAAIAGLIASVGTGIDSQIIILDRALRKEEERLETIGEKLKKAFFIIFGSAGTVIAAMLPLMILGFGVLRGFAIITIIGVLVGVFIARPAYGVIVEKMSRE